MSDMLESWFLRLFFNFTDPATDLATRRRIALICGLTVIGIFLLLIFGLHAFVQGKMTLVVVDLGSAVILVMNLIDAKRRKKYDQNIYIGIIVVSVLYISLYVYEGKDTPTYVWYYTYPLFACYNLGAKRGSMASLLMTLPVLLLMISPPGSTIFASYVLDFEIRFLFSYLVVVAFSYLIEKARAKNEAELKHVNLFLEKEVRRRTLEIRKANQILIQENKKRKKATKEIQLSNERFLTILKSIDASIYVADLDSYKIIFMNQNMIETYGRDMTGQTCWESFKGEAAPCELCPRDKILDAEQNPTGAYSWQEKNPVTGQWFIKNDRAVRWIDGRIVHLQVATDITRLKEMEAQLIQAQKMESIGHLAGGIAHDFNNILSPIICYSEMLMDDLPGRSREHQNAQQILSAGKRGRDLVRQILTLSRQSENKLTTVHLQHILKEVLYLLRSTIPSNIDIIQDIQFNCCAVKANPTQVHQIAMNLITNAYHAVEQTGGKIAVHLKETELTEIDIESRGIPPGRYALLTVSDTGSGINLEDINKIFDPYFTTKERGKGTGLGLAVVYGIVKEHQGDITVRSDVARGTTFKVYLPIADAPVESASDREVYYREKADIRIMVVDDEVIIADVMGQILRRLKYRVKTFTSSIDALNAFKQSPDAFDLVITDMTMPKMMGDRLFKELTSIRPAIPIIISTGFSEKIDHEKAMAMGVKGFMMKPVSKSDMIRTIQEVLYGPRSGSVSSDAAY